MKKNDVLFSKTDAFNTLSTINMWIVACDTKASILLGFIGAATTIAFSFDYATKLYGILIHFIEKHDLPINILYILALFISTACTIAGLICLISVITPRIISTIKKKNHKDIKYTSLMFYDSVAKIDFFTYCNRVKEYNEEKIIKDLCFQIHAASSICSKKYSLLKKGILLFFVGLFLSFIELFIAYICNKL